MKKILPVILTCLSALLPAAAGAEDKLDDIAAVVNRDVILTSELDSFVSKIMSRSARSGEQLPDDVTVRREALKCLYSITSQSEFFDFPDSLQTKRKVFQFRWSTFPEI